MEKSDDKISEATESQSLREAIRQARVAEAEHIDATLDGRSAELARLEILRGDLEKLFNDIPAGDDRFELALVPTSPVRLWIDIFTYVAMDPAAQSYRLVRNHREGRRILLETDDVSVMRGRVADHVARQIVARERQSNGLEDLPQYARRRKPGTGTGLVFAAFVIGIVTGAAGLMALGWLLTR